MMASTEVHSTSQSKHRPLIHQAMNACCRNKPHFHCNLPAVWHQMTLGGSQMTKAAPPTRSELHDKPSPLIHLHLHSPCLPHPRGLTGGRTHLPLAERASATSRAGAGFIPGGGAAIAFAAAARAAVAAAAGSPVSSSVAVGAVAVIFPMLVLRAPCCWEPRSPPSPPQPSVRGKPRRVRRASECIAQAAHPLQLTARTLLWTVLCACTLPLKNIAIGNASGASLETMRRLM
jgi:hypothetical protein